MIVLCGGTSQRAGVPDKTALDLGGTTVLDRVLDALPPRWPVVCVGVERGTTRAVTWVREEPPLGGPVAGIAAALDVLDAPVVVVIAGDQPFAGGVADGLVSELRSRDDVDGVGVLLPGSDRPQLLLAAYRRRPLRAVAPPGTRDVAVKRTLGTLAVDGLATPAHVGHDIDTPADAEHARTLLDGRDRAPE